MLRNEILSLASEQAQNLVGNILRREITKVLRISIDEIENDRPLDEIGLDSLTAFELKTGLETRYKLRIPLSSLRQYPSINSFVSLVMENVQIIAGRENEE